MFDGGRLFYEFDATKLRQITDNLTTLDFKGMGVSQAVCQKTAWGSQR